MGLNDIERSTNMAVLNLTATVAEQSVNVATSSRVGRGPVSKVLVKTNGAAGTVKVATKAGGPYVTLAVTDQIDLGSVLPGDVSQSLFYIRGSVDAAFDLVIWN